MLNMLMTITEGKHRFFERGFRPVTLRQLEADHQVDNEDGFFTGLPLSMSSSKRNMHLGLHQEERVFVKIAKEQHKLRRIEEMLQRQKQLIEGVGKKAPRGGLGKIDIQNFADRIPAELISNVVAHSFEVSD